MPEPVGRDRASGPLDPGGDLMLLHPDGSEELLVAGGDDGSIADPAVSFDGQWVYYSHIHGLKGTSQVGLPPSRGADIYKIHVQTRQIVRLTDQTFTPNPGAADWSRDFRTPKQGETWLGYGVLNMGPCPLPGGRLAFVSNRNGFRPPKHLRRPCSSSSWTTTATMSSASAISTSAWPCTRPC